MGNRSDAEVEIEESSELDHRATGIDMLWPPISLSAWAIGAPAELQLRSPLHRPKTTPAGSIAKEVMAFVPV
jgi:hypothetical protein